MQEMIVRSVLIYCITTGQADSLLGSVFATAPFCRSAVILLSLGMSVCSTSGRCISLTQLPCHKHFDRTSFPSGRRPAALLSRESCISVELCTLIASCGHLPRSKRRKLARIVARAQPKTVPIQGTWHVLATLAYKCITQFCLVFGI